jgi:signal transduction histidine kinase
MAPTSSVDDATRRYRLLLDLARDVTAQRELPDVLETTFASMRQILKFTGGSISLIDDEGYLAFAATDPPATIDALAMRVPVGQGISGGIAESGEPAYLPDITADPRVTAQRREKSTSGGVRSFFGVPLITEGRPIGVLQIDSVAVDAFDDEDRLLVLSFTPIVAAAVQNARLYAREAAAIERLRELDVRHRDFVATVSHELRTPLTTILGYLDTILSHHDQLKPDDVLGLVHRGRRSATHLARLVEELLDMSLIQRGQIPLQPEDVDITTLLDDVVDDYSSLERIVRISAEPGLTVSTDRVRLTQVVGNLLTNALKFSPDDAPVSLVSRRRDGGVEISVVDAGQGIPPEARAKIFERFVQLERATTRRVGGFGIGLFVVHELCRAIGAEVSVESELGSGSTFRVLVPLTLPAE